MYYETITDYLEEQVRKPIMKAFEEGDKKEFLSILGFVLYKYVEQNSGMLAYEKILRESGIDIGNLFKRWQEIVSEENEKHKDYFEEKFNNEKEI